MLKKIVIIGFPIPDLTNERTEAFGYRTKIFLEALKEKYFTYVYAFTKKDKNLIFIEKNEENFVYKEFNKFSKVKNEIKNINPLAVIGISIKGSLFCTLLNENYLFWFDIPGDPIPEYQIASYYNKNYNSLESLIYIYSKLLKFGDKFSVCSTPSKYTLIGFLESLGLVNSKTFQYEFCYVINNSTFREKTKKYFNKDDKKFKVVWSGGYNVWSDVSTLFHGLENAIKQNNNIVFFSTGEGAVNNIKYNQLCQLVNNSKYIHNFNLLGWQKTINDVYKIWDECNIGICTDIMSYETEIGNRTRLFDMIGYGLPVIISKGSEISIIVEKYGVGYTFESGNIEQLTKLLLKLSNEGIDYNKFLECREKFIQDFSAKRVCEPLLIWLKNPKKKPIKKTNLYDKLLKFLQFINWNFFKRYF